MIIIQLIIFLFLFLTPIEGPKAAGAGSSNIANEVIVYDYLDIINSNMFMKRIEWINELGDDKDKYNVIVEYGKVEGINCNRCVKSVNFYNKSNYKKEFKSHNDAHKKMEKLFFESADEINKRFEKMKSFKTKLVNEGSSCLTIIKASGHFVCEVCKNSKNDIRMAVFFGGDLDDIRKHINNSNHKKAIKDKGIDVNNFPADMIFPDFANAEQYYDYCKKNDEDFAPQDYGSLLDTNNPLYGGSSLLYHPGASGYTNQPWDSQYHQSSTVQQQTSGIENKEGFINSLFDYNPDDYGWKKYDGNSDD